MACPLTKGHSIDCRDSIGGIQEVLITEFENIDATATVVAAGVITTLTQVVSTDFFRYSLEKENGSFVETETVSVENGTTMYETVLNFTIKKMAAAESQEIKLLALNRLYIIIKDNNGVHWAMGNEFATDKVGGTNQAASGQAFGDMNGYTLGFTSKEREPMYEVDAAVVAGLRIA
jgi:hypothetical protein